MKNFKLAFLVVIFALTAVSAYSQQKLRGRVIEILDGKTVVIQLNTNHKITAGLQFIEVPEPQQPLHQIVKEHLQKLVLGQEAEFQPLRLFNSMSVGRLVVNGVDISQQMIRDGAAWYAVLEKNSQLPAESETYRRTEAQAKTEKRGVWGIENLKPAWEFRAETEGSRWRELEKVSDKSDAEKSLTAEVQNSQSKPRAGLRTEFGATVSDDFTGFDFNRTENSSELYYEKIPGSNVSYISTGSGFFKIADAGSNVNVESRAACFYLKNESFNNTGRIFLIAFRASAEQWRATETDELIFTAGKQKIFSGKSWRFAKSVVSNGHRVIFYEISENALRKLAKAQNVTIKIGKFSGKFSGDYQVLIGKLVDMTEMKNN